MYIEDFLSESVIQKLENALTNIYNNEQFIIEVLSGLDSDEEANTLLEHIERTKNITVEDVFIAVCIIRNSRK